MIVFCQVIKATAVQVIPGAVVIKAAALYAVSGAVWGVIIKHSAIRILLKIVQLVPPKRQLIQMIDPGVAPHDLCTVGDHIPVGQAVRLGPCLYLIAPPSLR